MPLSQVPALEPASAAARPSPWLRRVGRAVVVLAVIGLALLLLAHAGSFLVIHAPQHSDVLVVLEGGDGSSRFEQAVRLQKQGYAPRVLVDADVTRNYYGTTEAALVMDFLRRTRQSDIEVCPTVADSTFSEAADVQRCLKRAGASSAIIVTSDFHTRRALSTFRKRLPQYQWSVAASSWPGNAAEQYWKHRWWAKTVVGEWQSLLWWELVDRWRSDVALK